MTWGTTKPWRKPIPFNDWSKERLAAGVKCCTSRHMKYTNDERVAWISPKLPWWFIRTYLWQPEGAKNPSELQAVVDEIYKRKVPDDEEFFVHFLKKKKEASP